MEWTRTETLALALPSCRFCYGIGARTLRGGQLKPCSCVLRSIFRACYARFRSCVEKEKRLSVASLDGLQRGGRRVVWGRKNEEYIADFCLVTRRTLTSDEWLLFSSHYLLGADWRLCSRRLQIERGDFFHAIYRLEQKLGLVYHHLQPYPLFPTDDYFNGAGWETTHRPASPVPMRRLPSLHERLNVPVRRAA